MSKRRTLERPGEVLSVALRLANRGFSRPQIVDAVLREDQVLELQGLAGVDAARAFAGRTADVALERVATRPAARDRGAFLLEIAEIRASADLHPWPGRTGPTDRRVLEGAYVTAELAKSTAFGLSARSWSMRVGLPWRTVLNSRDRLVSAVALTIIAPSERSQGRAVRYRIEHLSRNWHSRSLPPEEVPVPDQGLPAWHDAFRPNALDSIGWFVLRRLNPAEAVGAVCLANVSGLTRTRAYAALGALQRVGLARRVPDGWVRPDDEDLPELLIRAAALHGTLGAGAAEAGWYVLERRQDLDRRTSKASSLSVPVTGRPIDELENEARLVIAEHADGRVVVGR